MAEFFDRFYDKSKDYVWKGGESCRSDLAHGAIWAHHDGKRVILADGVTEHRLSPHLFDVLKLEGVVVKDRVGFEKDVDIYALPSRCF